MQSGMAGAARMGRCTGVRQWMFAGVRGFPSPWCRCAWVAPRSRRPRPLWSRQCQLRGATRRGALCVWVAEVAGWLRTLGRRPLRALCRVFGPTRVL